MQSTRMSHDFIECNQDQQHPLPKGLSEWVEEDSFERFLSAVLPRFSFNK